MIEYTYDIITTDEERQVCEVMFHSPGREDIHVCMHWPWDGKTFEEVIGLYAPIHHWKELENQ
jgi:hypothetical protein